MNVQQPESIWLDSGTEPIRHEDLKIGYSSSMFEKIINLSRIDPDTFVNFAMSFNAPSTGPNAWYPPTELFSLPCGETVGMTCEMHRTWQDIISNNPMVYIEAPREHSKSTRVTIGRVIWEIGNNPNLRIKIVAQNDDKASEIVNAISIHILNNERVRAVFPTLRPDVYSQWSRHKLYVQRTIISRDASIEGSGVLSAGVGGRADLLIFDDPVDYKNAIQFAALRETVKQAYYGVWLNLLPAHGGRVVYICTPWHMNDLSMDIKQNHSEYMVSSNPIDENMTPVWPAKWNNVALAQRLKNVGRREFDRGFKLRPLSDEDSLFNEDVFNKYYDYDLNLGELPGDGEVKRWSFYTGVDLGIGKKTTNTPTSIFTFGMRKGFPNVPVEIKVGHISEIEKIKQVRATYERWDSTLIAVENNSYQETFVSWLKDMDCKLPVRGLNTGSQKIDLTVGLPSMAVEIENGMWLIPKGGHKNIARTDNIWTSRNKLCTCPICKWLNECFAYPAGSSDILMSWWIAREGFRNLSSRIGPRLRVMTIRTKPMHSRGGKIDHDDGDD